MTTTQSTLAIQNLVEVLQEDLKIRSKQLEQMNALIETRNQLLTEQVTKQNQMPKWYAGIAGLVAVIIGLWVASLIISMVDDMNNMSAKMSFMETYMKNMGEGDRASGEASYMASMAGNMSKMSTDMAAMRQDMGAMNTSMGTMSGDMSQMNNNVGTMTKAVDSMSGSVGRMNVDTNIMRNGVQRMARDTGYMGQPFRAMDSVVPW